MPCGPCSPSRSSCAVKAGNAVGTFPVVRLITRMNIGGPARQALLLTRELAETYPTLLAAGTPSVLEGELADPAVRVERVPLVRPVRPGTDLRALAAIRRMLRHHRPRLLHTHTAKAGTLGRLAGASIGRDRPKMVHTFHGHVLDGYFHPLLQRSFVEVERRLAASHRCTHRRQPTGTRRPAGARNRHPEQFRVVPLGLDLRPFSATATSDARGRLRARLGLSSDTPLVGAVGRLVPIKDIGTLLAAVARLPGVHLAILGDGQSRQQLEAGREKDSVWPVESTFWAGTTT